MKNIYYTWENFEKDMKHLAKTFITYNGLIKDIYGIPKGGLVPATKLAHLIGKPLLLDKKKISKRTLIIDDISDTGNTLKKLLNKKQYFSVVTLFMVTGTKFPPSMYCNLKDGKEKSWIVFPWEAK